MAYRDHLSDPPEAIRWSADGAAIDLLDQTALPGSERRIRLETREEVADAIRQMKVRGAPAIGIAAAMGLALDLARHVPPTRGALLSRVDETSELLLATRPTARNLGWALERLRDAVRERNAAGAQELARVLMEEAGLILEEDRAMCRRIGAHGEPLIRTGSRVMTHCNAGALATGGIGTALAPVYVAHAAGRAVHVWVRETRPLLQGSRLTTWELMRAGVPVTLLADAAAGSVMQKGLVDLVIVGADRIAANGDVANKIGTYPLAVLAARHGIPFYVAAPASTLDPDTDQGAGIPIEERDADEVRRGFGPLTAPAEVPVHAPAFDITPAELIAAIITDAGVIRPPYAPGIAAAVRESASRRTPAASAAAAEKRS